MNQLYNIMTSNQGSKDVARYIYGQHQPQTLAEITENLNGVIDSNKLEDILKDLIEDGQIVCKHISGGCSLYWKAALETASKESESKGTNFKTPVLKRALRPSSSSSRRPFKSPATVQRSSTSGTPYRLSSQASSEQTHESPADVAREILTIKAELQKVEGEVNELSKDYHVQELQSHIDTLHEYNEIKDAGQALLGKLAEVEGTTTACLYDRYDLELSN